MWHWKVVIDSKAFVFSRLTNRSPEEREITHWIEVSSQWFDVHPVHVWLGSCTIVYVSQASAHGYLQHMVRGCLHRETIWAVSSWLPIVWSTKVGGALSQDTTVVHVMCIFVPSLPPSLLNSLPLPSLPSSPLPPSLPLPSLPGSNYPRVEVLTIKDIEKEYLLIRAKLSLIQKDVSLTTQLSGNTTERCASPCISRPTVNWRTVCERLFWTAHQTDQSLNPFTTDKPRTVSKIWEIQALTSFN